LNKGFNITFRHSVGNLHIYLSGEFNGMCAWELFKTIKHRYAGSGRIFVNTAGLNRVLSSGVKLFKSHPTRAVVSLEQLYFKGKAGFKIAPGGSRVIICKNTNTEGKNEKSTDYLWHDNR
jgi:hypothetical protein